VARRTFSYSFRLPRERPEPRPVSSCVATRALTLTEKTRNKLLLPYYYAHPLKWWLRFEDQASIEFHPWRSFSSDTQKKYFPDNRIGKWLFAALFWLEDHVPKLFLRYGEYPMIVLRKRI
jgi:hypothetical protein